MDPEALLEGLDDAQRAAVTSTAQPLVVLAPAGSGKTRVLTRRIAHRVATGTADPRHVLALTFTRKAAGRARRPPAGASGSAATPPPARSTRVAWGTLRTRWADQGRTAAHPARSQGPPAHGAGARRRPARTSARSPPTSPPRSSGPRPGWSPPTPTWRRSLGASRRPALKPEIVAEAYAAYETRKRRGGLVDFDDLLALVARALEEDDAFAAAQRWRFRHLFVDELQDVNPLQFRLLEAWRGDRYDVTAVGDPQQAIYGWNGADAGFLLDIHRWWPPAEVIELDRSYRSTPEILDGAAAVLRGARQPASDGRWPRGPPARRPTSPATPTTAPRPSPSPVPVRLARAPGRRWSEQAVLVRTHAQTHLIAEALRGAGIPHRVRGGAAFLDRPDVRRALRDLRSAGVPLGTAWPTSSSSRRPARSRTDEALDLPERRDRRPGGGPRPPGRRAGRPRGAAPHGPRLPAPRPRGRRRHLQRVADRHRAVRGRPPGRTATPSTWRRSTPPRGSSGPPCTSPAWRTATCRSPTPARRPPAPRRPDSCTSP